MVQEGLSGIARVEEGLQGKITNITLQIFEKVIWGAHLERWLSG